MLEDTQPAPVLPQDEKGNSMSSAKESESKVPDIDIGKSGDDYRYPIKKPESGDSWDVLFERLSKADEAQCKVWRDQVQNLLLFAALFSAVITAFVVETYKILLGPDSNDAMVDVLSVIASRIGNPGLNDSFILAPSPKFSPPRSAVRVNIFFFLSLVFSLSSALIGIIGLQWLTEHRSYPSDASSEQRSAMLHMRTAALKRWHVDRFFLSLPLIIQLAFIFFFIGLIDFLFHIDPTVGIVVTFFIGGALLFLVITTVLPALQAISIIFPQLQINNRVPSVCPYRSPQSQIILQLVHSPKLGSRLCLGVFALDYSVFVQVVRSYMWAKKTCGDALEKWIRKFKKWRNLRRLKLMDPQAVMDDIMTKNQQPTAARRVDDLDRVESQTQPIEQPGLPSTEDQSAKPSASQFCSVLASIFTKVRGRQLEVSNQSSIPERFLEWSYHDSFQMLTGEWNWWNFDESWMAIRDQYFRFHVCRKGSWLHTTQFEQRYRGKHAEDGSSYVYDAIQSLRVAVEGNFRLEDESVVLAAFHCARALPDALRADAVKSPSSDSGNRSKTSEAMKDAMRTRNHYLSYILRSRGADKQKMTHLSDVLSDPTIDVLEDENACIFLDFIRYKDQQKFYGSHTTSKTFMEAQLRLLAFLYEDIFDLDKEPTDQTHTQKPLIIRPDQLIQMSEIDEPGQPFTLKWAFILDSFFKSTTKGPLKKTFHAHPVFQDFLYHFWVQMRYAMYENAADDAIEQSSSTLDFITSSLSQGVNQIKANQYDYLFYHGAYTFAIICSVMEHSYHFRQGNCPGLAKAMRDLYSCLQGYRQRFDVKTGHEADAPLMTGGGDQYFIGDSGQDQSTIDSSQRLVYLKFPGSTYSDTWWTALENLWVQISSDLATTIGIIVVGDSESNQEANISESTQITDSEHAQVGQAIIEPAAHNRPDIDLEPQFLSP